MSARHQNINRKKEDKSFGRRWLPVLLGICLFLGQMNLDSVLSHAEGTTVVQVGEHATALLENGRLTLSGHGETKDYTQEEAPFSQYAGEIRKLTIEDGITYIGSYLFYGLCNLGGDLTLPASITAFGRCAFSGGSAQSAPSFSSVINKAQNIQNIEAPEMLFYGGQSGIYSCTAENTAFVDAVSAAGYSSEETAGTDGGGGTGGRNVTGGLFRKLRMLRIKMKRLRLFLPFMSASQPAVTATVTGQGISHMVRSIRPRLNCPLTVR